MVTFGGSVSGEGGRGNLAVGYREILLVATTVMRGNVY